MLSLPPQLKSSDRPIFKRIFILTVSAYLLLFVLGACIIYLTYIGETKGSLTRMAQRINSDLKYHNGQWDVSEYNSDSRVPGRFRISIFTTEGFVIDRWRPIFGFLDTSDFKHLLTYETPQTVSTITNQEWRMFSQAVFDQEKVIGVIAVSQFSPDPTRLSNIDQRLEEVAQAVADQITVENGTINVSGVDGKLLPYDITFQIVDQYNHLIYKDRNASSVSQMPDFIDPSYVVKEAQQREARQIIDQSSNDKVLVTVLPIFSETQTLVGIIVVGTTVDLMYQILFNYLLVGSLLLIPSTFIFSWAVTQFIQQTSPPAEQSQALETDQLEKICFSKKDCVLTINHHHIPFTYATNQYYLLTALFYSTKNKWETDELLEKFGEAMNKNSWRKVYDAMTAINTKTAPFLSEKLIVVDNKTYRINPRLTDKITKI